MAAVSFCLFKLPAATVEVPAAAQQVAKAGRLPLGRPLASADQPTVVRTMQQ